MAARIPISMLTTSQQEKIIKDLHIVESNAKWGNKKTSLKAIDFYFRDQDEILIPYNYACKFFERPHINLRRKFYQVQPWTFKEGFQLREYQKEVLQIADKHYKDRGCVFFNVFCAFGKTVVGSYKAMQFSQSSNLLTLITYPRSILRDSWLGTLQNLANVKVYVVDLDNVQIPDDTQIILCMNTRIKKIPKEILSRVGHLIVDEADLYCTQGNVEGLLSIEPLFITLMTATYERDDGMHIMLDLLGGSERITRISTKPFFVFHYPTPFTPENVVTTSWGVQYDSIVAELDAIEERNLLIANLVIVNLDQKIMVLTYHVKHAEYLASCLSTLIAPYGKTVALLAGSVKEYFDSDVLVGTQKKIGIGFDEKEVAIGWKGRRINLLILASIGLKIEQIAGRVFRAETPVIIDLVDNYRNNKNHYSVRKKWYESRNGHITTIRDLNSAIWSMNGPALMEKCKSSPVSDRLVEDCHADSVVNRFLHNL